MPLKNSPKLILFVSVFTYVLLSGLFVQLVFLPYIYPQAHYGDGIFVQTDTILFHEEAKRLAQEIRSKGWGVWSLYPEPHRQVMVGITSIFYAITGVYKPYVMLPYNALLHALSVVFLVSFLQNLGFGNRQAVLASLPMIFFPSALSWTTQIHRDGLYILGFIMLFWSVSKVLKEERLKKLAIAIIFQGLAISVIYLARPHMTVVLKYSFIILLVLSIIVSVFVVVSRIKINALLNFTVFCIFAVVISSILSPAFERKETFEWIRQEFIPEKVDMLFRQLAETRYSFFKYHEGAKGNIEENFMPQKATDLIAYIPRGLFVGFFYPLPGFWFKEGGSATGTLARSIIPLETIFLWIGIVLLPFSLYGLRYKPAVFVVLFLSAVFVYLHVVSEPNVGPIVRKRFVFTTTLIAISFAFLFGRLGLGRGKNSP